MLELAESPLTEVSYPPNYSDYWYEDGYVYVSPEEVLHLIKGLDVNKASGPEMEYLCTCLKL